MPYRLCRLSGQNGVRSTRQRQSPLGRLPCHSSDDREERPDVAETAFRLGERGFMEVLDTQRVLRNTRSELLQAQFELQAAAAEIDRLRAHYPQDQYIE